MPTTPTRSYHSASITLLSRISNIVLSVTMQKPLHAPPSPLLFRSFVNQLRLFDGLAYGRACRDRVDTCYRQVAGEFYTVHYPRSRCVNPGNVHNIKRVTITLEISRVSKLHCGRVQG